MLSSQQVLDRYFPEVRAWLIQTAAVMDRLDRAAGSPHAVPEDERLIQFYKSLEVLASNDHEADRAKKIQMIFSDQTPAPSRD